MSAPLTRLPVLSTTVTFSVPTPEAVNVPVALTLNEVL